MTPLKKIASFTLTETLVVLAISAIVAGLAFSIITLFSKNLYLIQNNYSHSTEMQLLEQQLMVDFNRYHDISYNPSSDMLTLKTPLDSILYTFDKGFLLRNKDTILSLNYNKKFYYTGETKQNGNIDALKLTIGDKGSEQFLFIDKTNAANQYLRHGD